MASSKKPRIALFKQVCESKGGNLTEIAKAFSCVRRTANYWMETDPKYKEVLEDVRESMVDLCESQLVRLATGIPKYSKNEKGEKYLSGWNERPDTAAVIFTLKTRGRDRGYIERLDITSKDEKIGMSKEDIKAEIQRIDDILNKK